MNYPLIFRYLTVILISVCLSFLVCIGVALGFDTNLHDESVKGWTISLLITVGLTLISHIIGRKHNGQLFRREALCIIGVGWIVSCLLGALPYYFTITEMPFSDALFESTSGLTTTGASTINQIEELPNSLLFWRSFSQWIGGLGVVVLFVAILSSVGAGAKILYSNEASASSNEIESSRVQSDAFRIFGIYLILSVCCASAFYLEGMTFFDALCHMFATVSSGGFSTKSESMAFFNSATIELTCVFFMVLAGISFLLILKSLRSGPKFLLKNTELITYLSLISFFTLFISFMIHASFNTSISACIRIALFQVTSIITTTGFSTIDYDLAAPVAHVFLLILMLIGGCSGSTSGGLKLIRIIGSIKVINYYLQRTFRPRSIRSISIDGKPLSFASQEGIVTHMTVTVFIIMISLFIVSFLEGDFSFEGNFSAVMACLYNVGPGFAEVGPAQNYSFLNESNKVFLSLLMVLGRLEYYAILVLFFPSFWKKFS